MHVGINAHLLCGRQTYRSAGVHQYIDHLLNHLPAAGCRVTAFLGPDSVCGDTEISQHRSRWSTENPLMRAIWEQLLQPRALRQANVDLAHGPVFVGPLGVTCPLVITIHDLSFLRFPHLFRPANRLYLTVLTRASARRASRIIAVSEHAASEAVDLLGVERDKVDVVYHGVDRTFRPLPETERAALRERLGLPSHFVLFLGTLEPRKNLTRLIEAFAQLHQPDLKLVLAGGRGWYDQEIFARIKELGIEKDVVLPGFIPGADLPLWYNAATILAYPSLYEGFGMPVLESLASGTPVLTSNCSSLPEAAGDAALLVDPNSVEAIANGLKQLLTDSGLRDELRAKGLAHAANFTWEKTAANTVAVYQRAMAEEVA